MTLVTPAKESSVPRENLSGDSLHPAQVGAYSLRRCANVGKVYVFPDVQTRDSSLDLRGFQFVFLSAVSVRFPHSEFPQMSIRIAFSAAAMTVVMAQAASASMVTFTNASLWNYFTTNQGGTVVSENFNSYSGFYASGLIGNVSGIQWTASAAGDLYADLGYMSTNAPSQSLTFALSPSVQGVAGNFFATDANFGILPAIIGVQLADGSAYVGYAASAADFVGFYSTGAAISSISVSVANVSGTQPIWATVDNLYFAVVPAPGALALVGIAGLVGGARKRR